MENLVKLGCPKRIVGFVLPTGYSFNLDGTLCIWRRFDFRCSGGRVELSWTQQIIMMLTLMLTSKGVAGVPRASLVILLGTLASFNLPVEGVILILGVDEVDGYGSDSGQCYRKLLGNGVITKWKGAFRNEEWQKEMAEVTPGPADVSL